MLSQFFGGIGPAIFLVLTGITLAFLMDRREQQGFDALARWKFALRRAGYLFSLAFLFRLQLWLFAYPQSPWTDLFKVDILNCMGLAIGLMSVMAIFTTADRVRLCAGLGIAIATAAPLVSAIDWSWLPAASFGLFRTELSVFRLLPMGCVHRLRNQHRKPPAARQSRPDESRHAVGNLGWASA